MEVARHGVYNTHMPMFTFLAAKLANKPNSTLDDECMKIILQSTTLQLNERNLQSIANSSLRGLPTLNSDIQSINELEVRKGLVSSMTAKIEVINNSPEMTFAIYSTKERELSIPPT